MAQKDNKNMNFEKFENKATNEAWATITKEKIYNGRLMAVRISKENPKFIDDGHEPRDLISFVFDVINDAGESVHVSTKPSTVSFTDKSKLPQVWANAFELKSASDIAKNLYKDGKLQPIPVSVYVSVVKKEDKVYNDVTKVVELLDKSEQKPSPATSWDLKVYGQDANEYDLAEGYELLK